MTRAISAPPDTPSERTALDGRGDCVSPYISSMAPFRTDVMSFRSFAWLFRGGGVDWQWRERLLADDRLDVTAIDVLHEGMLMRDSAPGATM